MIYFYLFNKNGLNVVIAVLLSLDTLYDFDISIYLSAITGSNIRKNNKNERKKYDSMLVCMWYSNLIYNFINMYSLRLIK